MNENTNKILDQSLKLREVEGTEIISLMDNSVDFLSTIEREEVHQVRKWVKERKGDKWTEENFRLPMAEHGFSMRSTSPLFQQ